MPYQNCVNHLTDFRTENWAQFANFIGSSKRTLALQFFTIFPDSICSSNSECIFSSPGFELSWRNNLFVCFAVGCLLHIPHSHSASAPRSPTADQQCGNTRTGVLGTTLGDMHKTWALYPPLPCTAWDPQQVCTRALWPTKSSLLPLAADHRSSHSVEDVEQWPSVEGSRRHQWVRETPAGVCSHAAPRATLLHRPPLLSNSFPFLPSA